MKAMTKKALADCAGVSTKTLRRWCMKYEKELSAMGWDARSRQLPPHIIKFLTTKLCIDLNDDAPP